MQRLDVGGVPREHFQDVASLDGPDVDGILAASQPLTSHYKLHIPDLGRWLPLSPHQSPPPNLRTWAGNEREHVPGQSLAKAVRRCKGAEVPVAEQVLS